MNEERRRILWRLCLFCGDRVDPWLHDCPARRAIGWAHEPSDDPRTTVYFVDREGEVVARIANLAELA
jgi:hypothetical protein